MAPQNLNFFQKSIKILSYDGLWSKMPLGSLQKPAKSLPRAVPEPSRSPSQPSEASCQAPTRTPRACFAIFKSKFAISSVWPKPGPKRSNLIHFSTISGQHLQIRILGPNLQFPRFDQKLVPNDRISCIFWPFLGNTSKFEIWVQMYNFLGLTKN